MTIPIFTHQSSVVVASKGWTIFIGPNPFDDLVRGEARGRRVSHEGREKVIVAVEAFAKASEPRKGEAVGFVFEPESARGT